MVILIYIYNAKYLYIFIRQKYRENNIAHYGLPAPTFGAFRFKKTFDFKFLVRYTIVQSTPQHNYDVNKRSIFGAVVLPKL